MNKHLIAGTGIFLLAGIGASSAQDVIVLKPEQQVVVREYVQKKPLIGIDLPGIELNIGTKLPDTVQLETIEVPDSTYRYVGVGSRTAIVDPNTREIIGFID